MPQNSVSGLTGCASSEGVHIMSSVRFMEFAYEPRWCGTILFDYWHTLQSFLLAHVSIWCECEILAFSYFWGRSASIHIHQPAIWNYRWGGLPVSPLQASKLKILPKQWFSFLQNDSSKKSFLRVQAIFFVPWSSMVFCCAQIKRSSMWFRQII